jgi:hypothetical protein
MLFKFDDMLSQRFRTLSKPNNASFRFIWRKSAIWIAADLAQKEGYKVVGVSTYTTDEGLEERDLVDTIVAMSK